jgi:hypothetical protein
MEIKKCEGMSEGSCEVQCPVETRMFGIYGTHVNNLKKWAKLK